MVLTSLVASVPWQRAIDLWSRAQAAQLRADEARDLGGARPGGPGARGCADGSLFFGSFGGFHSHGGTQYSWMVYFMENPSKIGDLGVPL